MAGNMAFLGHEDSPISQETLQGYGTKVGYPGGGNEGCAKRVCSETTCLTTTCTPTQEDPPLISPEAPNPGHS